MSCDCIEILERRNQLNNIKKIIWPRIPKTGSEHFVALLKHYMNGTLVVNDGSVVGAYWPWSDHEPIESFSHL